MHKPFFWMACMVSLAGCSKSNKPSGNTPDQAKTDVYIVGTQGIGSSARAVYWKNDSLVMLGDNLPSEGQAIAVYNGTVYVAGVKNGKLGYWKNGDFAALSDTNSIGSVNMSATGNYSFIVTRSPNSRQAEYYRSDELVGLPSSENGVATGICVVGPSVYVSGFVKNVEGKQVAVFWKDGQRVDLTDGKKDAYASAITWANNQLYVAGGEIASDGDHWVAKYWAAGAPFSVSDSANSFITTGISVFGPNIFLSGYKTSGGNNGDSTLALYWNNGVAANIGEGDWGTIATSVANDKENYYVVFRKSDYSDGSVANYYWNGQVVALNNPDGLPSVANGLFLVSN